MPIPTAEELGYYPGTVAGQQAIAGSIDPTQIGDEELARALGIAPTDPRMAEARRLLGVGASLETVNYWMGVTPQDYTTSPVRDTSGMPGGIAASTNFGGEFVGATGLTPEQMAERYSLPEGTRYLSNAESDANTQDFYSGDLRRNFARAAGLSLLGGGIAALGAGAGVAGAAGAGGAYGGAATTYPLAAAGPISVSPLAGAGAAGAAAAGAGSGLGAGGASGLAGASGAANALGTAGATSGNWLDRFLPYISTGASSLLGAYGADQAMDAETAAYQQAIEEQRRQYDQNRQDMMPWLTAGQGALGNLQNPQASFAASPGYEWARNEGQRGIGNSFAARGGAASGNALRALSEFNTGLAQQDYGNWWNQQAGLAGVGQTAAGQLGNQGMYSSNQIGQSLANQGISRGSGVANRYGAIGQGLSDSLNWLWRRRQGY